MARPVRTPVADRNRQLGRIHAGKKALGMDDDTYRCLLERVTGKRSSADMTGTERNAVIAELVRLGFKADDTKRRKGVFAGKPKNVKDVPLLRKVEALLTDGKKPWSYAHAMAQQMFKRDRIEFLRPDELHKLVSALQIDANKKGAVQ